MKRKKNWFFAVIVIAVSIVLFFQYKSQTEMEDMISDSITSAIINTNNSEQDKDSLQQAVNDIVNEEIIGNLTVENNNESEVIKTPSIADTIKDTLNNVNEETYQSGNVKVISIESSNKLVIEQDGKQIKIRLIGVHSSGSKDGLRSLITDINNLVVETDIKKTEGDYKLVYLWDGEALDDGSNMINLKMIKKEFAYSTYDFVHPGVIETPNIKYQHFFIDAIKNN